MRLNFARFTVVSACAFSCLQMALAAGRAQGPTGNTKPVGRVLHVAHAGLSDVPDKNQFRTISAAARAIEAGDTVVIHDGVYRESVVVEKSGTADQPIRSWPHRPPG